MSSSKARPLRDRPPNDARSDGRGLPLFRAEAFTDRQARPAFRRVLPALLTAIDSHIQHAIGAAHGLTAPACGPVRLEDAAAVAQIAGLHAKVVSRHDGKTDVGLLGHGVPGHIPAHELAVVVALVERALAEGGKGNVARVQVRQLQGLAGVEGAAFALVGGREACVPHVVGGEELGAPFEGVKQ